MESRSHRVWAGLTVVTGLATVAITVAFQRLPEVATAGRAGRRARWWTSSWPAPWPTC
uniref:Uncharacterized protein n=1 Tax=Phenylobacterium glaciei TaxID=2803784 RepID=A0A974P4P9_9CAUL|nr:hypothetical protein JKL49_08645 [Phenylobacterium glaciei]